MAAGDITWFRYARHGDREQPVGPDDLHLPAHHGHYSFLQKMDEPVGIWTSAKIEAERSAREAQIPKIAITEPEIDHKAPDLLIQERNTTHGDFEENARISQDIKATFKRQRGYGALTPVQRESLDMIALKVSRILSGRPDEPDHWDDIAGYARLASKSRRG